MPAVPDPSTSQGVPSPEPLRIGRDTWLIRAPADRRNPRGVWVNSMVVAGREPVVVDTGTARDRRRWMADVFSVVEPDDVRWIFLSHDDPDHTGNLVGLLDACSNATLITTRPATWRTLGDLGIAPRRIRWIEDGESFDAGDRPLVAVEPPIFDAPATRGLFDARTGIYWAADCFGIPSAVSVGDVSAQTAQDLEEEMLAFGRLLAPWHAWLDPARFAPRIDRIASLGVATIAGAHGPPLHGERARSAIEALHRLPSAAEAGPVTPGPTVPSLGEAPTNRRAR